MELNLEYNNRGAWYPYKTECGVLQPWPGDLVVDTWGDEYTLLATHGEDAWVENSNGNYGFARMDDLSLLVRAISPSYEVHRGPADEFASW